MKKEKLETSPVITLPSDDKWVSLLTEKLEYYKKRKVEKHKYKHPELAATTSVGYKIRVLSSLLEQGEIRTWDLSRSLHKEDDARFGLGSFQNACAVIAKYCEEKNFLILHLEKDRQKFGSLDQ